MPDTPTPPVRRLRGAPLNNLNALKHWISRQRPANSARPTSSTSPNPISPVSTMKSPCCASSSAASSSSSPAPAASPNPSKSCASSHLPPRRPSGSPPPVSPTPAGAPKGAHRPHPKIPRTSRGPGSLEELLNTAIAETRIELQKGGV